MLRLFKNSAILGAGAVIQKLLQIILLPIYTRVLTPADYGVISVLLVLAVALNTICECGLGNGIGRYFYWSEQEKVPQGTIVWTGLSFVLISSSIAALAVCLFNRPISRLLFDTPEHGYIVALTGIQVLVMGLSSITRTILNMQERMGSQNVWLIVEVGLSVGVGLTLVVGLDRGVVGAVEAALISAAGPMLWFARTTVLGFARGFSMPMLRKQLAFSLPMVAGVFAFWFIDSSDRYILNEYLSLSETGMYDMGYKLGTTIMIVVGSITTAWLPYYHRRGGGQDLVDGALKGALLLTSVAAVMLTVSAPLILDVLTAERFDGAHTVVPLVVLAYVLKLPYLLFATGIQMKNRTGILVLLEIVAAVVNVGANIVLIPRFGREAAAATTVVAYAIMTGGALWLVQRINPIPNLSWRLHLVTISVTSAALVGFTAAILRGASYPVVAAITCAGFAAGMLVLFGPREMKRSIQDMMTDPPVIDPAEPPSSPVR